MHLGCSLSQCHSPGEAAQRQTPPSCTTTGLFYGLTSNFLVKRRHFLAHTEAGGGSVGTLGRCGGTLWGTV